MLNNQSFRNDIETRIPHDSQYTELIGKAVYFFAYFEANVIHLIQQLDSNFLIKYYRLEKITYKNIIKEFDKNIEKTDFDSKIKLELKSCLNQYKELVNLRHKIIHAHPMSNADGAQILIYQTIPSKQTDKIWQVLDLIEAIEKFDEAACAVNKLLHELPKTISKEN